MSKTRDQINDFLREINVEGKTVLDVGAGRPRAWIFPPEGNPKVKGTPKDYKTADINPEFGCDYNFDLNDVPLSVLERFDYVFCLETLEHIWNPLGALTNLSNLVEEKLFITTPFVYPIHDVVDYLRYTLQWFEKVLPKYGFKDVEIIPRVATDKEGLHKFYVAEGSRMSKISRKLGYSKNYYDVGYNVIASKGGD